MKVNFTGHCLFLLCLFMCFNTFAQFSDVEITRKKNKLNNATRDTAKINICLEISNDYRYTNIDSSTWYAEKALEISRSIKNQSAEAAALSQKGFIVLETGDLPQSLRYQFLALDLLQKASDPEAIAFTLNRIGNIYMELGDFKKAIGYYKQSEDLFRKINKIPFVNNELSNIAYAYGMMGRLDSAKIYMQQVYTFSLTNTDRYAITYAEMRDRYGYIETLQGNYDSALLHYRVGIVEGKKDVDYRYLSAIYLHMAQLFFKLHQNDSCFYYVKKTIETAQTISWKKAVYEASDLLSKLFKLRNQPDSAVVYAELSAAVKDSLYGPDKVRTLQSIMLDEQQRQQLLEKEKIETAGKIRMYSMLAGIAVLLIVASLLYRNVIHRKKANVALQKQKEEIERQKKDIETTLADLKSAQAQLIQSEKMASLGELTAGIAHEIQNPLNFVNNFSEVNNELIDEMKTELAMGNMQLANEIADDIKLNLGKIEFHGKRAEAIVKGMLQHSRTSSGQKEPTDINSLCDEYLRLSFHGFRAKDKLFNATLKTDFDTAIGKVSIIPQDIGRVLLNLYNNAFYAINEKKNTSPGSASNLYEPTVSVSTKKVDGKIEIKVADNGNGIPQKVLDKIFQPFFTTKPTGQGTGLGLSLSYDIVKAHGGEIKVKTQEARPDDPVGRGEGTEFIIQLPAKDV